MSGSDRALTAVVPRSDFFWGRLLTAIAVLCAVGLLWPTLFAGPLALDEHCSYWMLDSELPASIHQRCLDYGAVPPLASWVQWLSLTAWGHSEWALRLPSLIAAILAVVCVYRIGVQLHSSLAGGIAACLLAWHPDTLDEVRIARAYGLVLLLAALLVWTTVTWTQRGSSWRWSCVWGLTSAALLWTHYTAALLIAACGLAHVVVRIWNTKGFVLKSWIDVLVGLALSGVLCLPLLPSLQRLSAWSPYLNMFAPEQPWWQIVSSYWWCGLPAGLVTVTLLSRWSNMARIESAPVVPRWSVGVMVACSLLPLLLLGLLAVGDLSSLANPRYRIPFVPAGAVLGGLLLGRGRHVNVAVAGTVITVVAAWSCLPVFPWQLVRLGSPTELNWQEVAVVLEQKASPHAPIFVQSGLVESSLVPVMLDDPLFHEYAACRVSRFYLRQPHPRLALPYFWDEATALWYRQWLHETVPTEIWVAAATDTDLNRQSLAGIQQVAQEAGLVITFRQTWPDVELLRLQPPRQEP